MKGIDLNRPITFEAASLRFFEPGEHHIDRFCRTNVLLIVYEGILRFSEDGINYEVLPGCYHIQKSHTYQKGARPSDAPKYLYVHFQGTWSEEGAVIPFRGTYDQESLMPLMKKLDHLAHGSATYIEQAAVFYGLLAALYRTPSEITLADRIAVYLSKEYLRNPSLSELSQQFHFSKNHILNVFKSSYQQTPLEYIHRLKLSRAEYLLEVTSESIERIAYLSGFHNYSQFYRLFLRKNGASPSYWRKTKRSEFDVEPEQRTGTE